MGEGKTISREETERIKNIPVAFIVGCGRSGTTLLQTMMNSHPNIVSTPECFFVILLYPRFGKLTKWKEKDITEFIDTLYTMPGFALWLMDREMLISAMRAVMDYADYALMCKMVYYQMRKDKENVMVLIDKNPSNSLFTDKLLKIFPEAKFIHIIREPRDCVNAHIKRFNKKNTFFLAWYWKGFNAAIEKVKQKSPVRFLTILYENFVRETEQTMKEICQFLNVPFDEKILQSNFAEILPQYKDNKTFDRIKIVHGNLLTPVNDANIGKWEKEMNKKDVAITEIIDGQYAAEKYGYNEDRKSEISISSARILRSKVQYYTWEAFTKLRFANYELNKYYRKRKMKAAERRRNKAT